MIDNDDAYKKLYNMVVSDPRFKILGYTIVELIELRALGRKQSWTPKKEKI